ncbi:MAG: DNA polymerase III subunit epsilon [Alphaproteobacteria bacterium]|nr:DNA polymerase III subunit epsilon [Alphaproteobacteria bacterium]
MKANGGDRLVEVGCVELYNRIPTGKEFHAFINPEGREVHPEAEAIHGISNAFLADKPVFSAIVEDFVAFIGDDQLVIHNAPFDIGFLNMELQRLRLPEIPMDRVVDTLALARRKHPAGPNTLDALCKRYGIDNTIRTKHGAIVDSLLLADVYVELLGERQAKLSLAQSGQDAVSGRRTEKALQRPEPLPSRLTADEIAHHEIFVASLGENALWRAYGVGDAVG